MALLWWLLWWLLLLLLLLLLLFEGVILTIVPPPPAPELSSEVRLDKEFMVRIPSRPTLTRRSPDDVKGERPVTGEVWGVNMWVGFKD